VDLGFHIVFADEMKIKVGKIEKVFFVMSSALFFANKFSSLFSSRDRLQVDDIAVNEMAKLKLTPHAQSLTHSHRRDSSSSTTTPVSCI
jgi:hypothetical protein